MAHTPGRWSIITDDDCPINISVDGSDEDSGQVCSQWVIVESETYAGFAAAVIDMNYPNSYNDELLNANARLIAAAPDLLDACAAAEDYLAASQFEGAQEIYHQLHTAIARAKGE